MDVFLLNVFAFLRPILLIEVNVRVLGLNLFDLAGILLIGIVAIPMLKHMVLTRYLLISIVDILMLLCILWATAVTIIYPQHSNVKEYVKWITPLLTYVVAKNITKDVSQYLNIVRLLILGTAVPLIVSAAMIAMGLGLDSVNYWSKLGIYSGVYSGSHTLGHNMVLFCMLGAIYFVVRKHRSGEDGPTVGKTAAIVFLILCCVALYNLYNSQLRTGMLGLALFLVMLLALYKRKWLLPVFGIAVIVGMAMAPRIALVFHDITAVVEGERDFEWAASGRPEIWMHNIQEYSGMSIDRQIAGAGIGNKIQTFRYAKDGGDSFWDSHNDWLGVFIQTGYVGFLLYLALQLAILRKILRIRGRERWVLLAFYLVVNIMNVMSNSYISRFGMAQMYYLLLSYVELSPVAKVRRTDETLYSGQVRVANV